MKRLTLLLIPFLFVMEISAKELISDNTIGHYSKPGAAIDMQYTAQKVDVNETADVNITLSTTIKQGTIFVSTHLDKKLTSITGYDENLSYEIMPNQQDYGINLQVKSEQQGLYYIRLLTKVDKGYGAKLRSFAIPIYVGEVVNIKKEKRDMQMKAMGSGENISVSQAIETIETIHESN